MACLRPKIIASFGVFSEASRVKSHKAHKSRKVRKARKVHKVHKVRKAHKVHRARKALPRDQVQTVVRATRAMARARRGDPILTLVMVLMVRVLMVMVLTGPTGTMEREGMAWARAMVRARVRPN